MIREVYESKKITQSAVVCGQEMIGKEAASGFLGIDVWKRVFRPITKEKFVTDGAFSRSNMGCLATYEYFKDLPIFGLLFILSVF